MIIIGMNKEEGIMKYSIAKKQIRRLFINPQDAMEAGLWFSGYEGEGEYKKWYSNGQLQSHSFYKNGSPVGENKMWLYNGKLITHQLIRDGEVIKDYLE